MAEKPLSACCNDEIAVHAEESPGWHFELHAAVTILCSHIDHLALATSKHIDDGSGEFLRYVDDGLLHGFRALSVFLTENHFRP